MLTPTIRLLLDAILQDSAVQTAKMFRGFSAWEDLFSRAVELRLAPQLACRLRSAGLLGIVPDPVRQKLTAAKNQNLGHNIACAGLTARIVELLSKEGIAAVLLKGIAHIHDCYPDFEGRVFRDIDLLVRREQLFAAAHCLQRAGFYQEQSERTGAEHHHIAPFFSTEGQAVEIHWNLDHPSSPSRIDPDELWKNVRPCAAIRGSYILHAVDSLIHTSVHLMISSDIARQIYQLIDIHWLIESHFDDNDNFSRLVNQAGKFGCQIPVSRALHIARNLLRTQVPQDAMDKLGYNRFPGRIMHHLILSTLTGPSEGVSNWRYAMYRDLLNYRKLMLRTNSKPRQTLYALTRPVAMLKDTVGLLRSAGRHS